MTFPHRDPEFEALLRIVADAEGLSVGLIEKDDWVTHTLWALQAAGFDIWFKGGTSLSKGFDLIERFSEDLDLRIDPGTAGGVVLPDPWDGRSRGAVRRRVADFESLTVRLLIPDVEVRPPQIEKNGRFASYEVVYPGTYREQVVGSGMRPFVLIEAGRARVAPFVERDLSSFVHDLLKAQRREEMLENMPRGVPCLHPVVTLMDKLDAISARFRRGADEAAFARHYEDAAQIIRGHERLPPLEVTPVELAKEMIECGDIRAIPSHEDHAFAPDPSRLEALQRACDLTAGLFWGDRIPPGECCTIIRKWIREHLS